MPKVNVYVSDSCPHCHDLKDKIAVWKKDGKIAGNINYIEYEKKPKIFDKKGIDIVPHIEIDGKKANQRDILKYCSLSAKSKCR